MAIDDRDKKPTDLLAEVKEKMAVVELLTAQMRELGPKIDMRLLDDPKESKKLDALEKGEKANYDKYKKFRDQIPGAMTKLDEAQQKYFVEKLDLIKTKLKKFKKTMAEEALAAVNGANQFPIGIGTMTQTLDTMAGALDLEADFKKPRYMGYDAAEINASIAKVSQSSYFKETAKKYKEAYRLLSIFSSFDIPKETAYLGLKELYTPSCQSVLKQGRGWFGSDKEGDALVKELDSQVKLIDKYATTEALTKTKKEIAKAVAAKTAAEKKQKEQSEKETKLSAWAKEHQTVLDAHLDFVHKKINPNYAAKIQERVEKKDNSIEFAKQQQREEGLDFKFAGSSDEIILNAKILQTQFEIMFEIKAKIFHFIDEKKPLKENAESLRELLEKPIKGGDFVTWGNDDFFRNKTYREILETPIPSQYCDPKYLPSAKARPGSIHAAPKTPLAEILNYVDTHAPKPKEEAKQDAAPPIPDM